MAPITRFEINRTMDIGMTAKHAKKITSPSEFPLFQSREIPKCNFSQEING